MKLDRFIVWPFSIEQVSQMLENVKKRVPALKLESKQTSGNLYTMVPPTKKNGL